VFSGGRKNGTHNKEIRIVFSPGRCLNHINDLRAYLFSTSKNKVDDQLGEYKKSGPRGG
jgi:hypothetical protein